MDDPSALHRSLRPDSFGGLRLVGGKLPEPRTGGRVDHAQPSCIVVVTNESTSEFACRML
jgi:hypothetical protein